MLFYVVLFFFFLWMVLLFIFIFGIQLPTSTTREIKKIVQKSKRFQIVLLVYHSKGGEA